jgi:hypothetical protein
MRFKAGLQAVAFYISAYCGKLTNCPGLQAGGILENSLFTPANATDPD